MPFSGTMRLCVIEAQDLKPSQFSVRHNIVAKGGQQMLIDPYVNVEVDDIRIDRSVTKQRTFQPIWNQYFDCDLNSAQNLVLTVFHDAAIPPDEFVANCTISLDELRANDRTESSVMSDLWVKLIIFISFIDF